MTEWTDDLTILLPPGRTVVELVDSVLRAKLQGVPDDQIQQHLEGEFELSQEDAALAWDRSLGGLVRAATRNPLNCPSPDKDPVAWESFQRGTQDTSLVARIYPQYAPKE